MSRKKIIAGNWKMNVKPSETAALIKGVAEATAQFGDKVEIVCCTPAIDVPAAVAAAAGTQVEVGANGVLSARSLELKVAAATAEKPAHSSTLKFTAGGRITLTGAFKSVADAQLEFDLTDWDKSTRLRFISCNGLEGTAVDWNNVSFTGVDKSDFSNAGGLKYVFRQTAHGIAVGKASGIAIIIR